jgi:hypothetical protein
MTTLKDNSSDVHKDGSQIPEPERRVERLLGLLIVGLMLLNFPLLSIFSLSAYFCGIPVLYFYLFSVWFLIIGVTAFIQQSRPSVPGGSDDSQDFREP